LNFSVIYRAYEILTGSRFIALTEMTKAQIMPVLIIRFRAKRDHCFSYWLAAKEILFI